MIEQRAVLKLLNENPVTETVPWIVGEPSVQEILGDPVVHAVLRRDGLSLQDLMGAIARGRLRLSPARRPPSSDIPTREVSPREVPLGDPIPCVAPRSAEHTSELQSLMRISYAVFCLNKQNNTEQHNNKE